MVGKLLNEYSMEREVCLKMESSSEMQLWKVIEQPVAKQD